MDKIESPAQIIYEEGNIFETLNYLDLDRKDKIFGYKLSFEHDNPVRYKDYIFHDIIIARKCGLPNLFHDKIGANQKRMSEYAEKMLLNGKEGTLLPMSVFKTLWRSATEQQIKTMDNFLLDNGVDAEQDFCGEFWFFEILDFAGKCGYYYDLANKELNKNAYEIFENGTIGCRWIFDDNSRSRLLMGFTEYLPVKKNTNPWYF